MIDSNSGRNENEAQAVPGCLPVFGGVLSAILGSILGAGVGILIFHVDRGGWPAGNLGELKIFARSVLIGALGGAVAGIGGFCLGFAFSGRKKHNVQSDTGTTETGIFRKGKNGTS
jgi:hypothetical protein